MMSNVIPLRIKPVHASHGEVHVWRSFEDVWACAHESASGGSWSAIDRFPTREEAVARALELVRYYQPCRLGRVGE